jgi:ABC-2 type transport system permease protein
MATNIRVLLRLASVIFRQGVTYRLEWLFGILSGFLALWIQVAVWQVLLGSGGPAASGSPVSAANMVTYLVVVRVVSTIVASTVSGEMESRLRTGDIADDLLRPTGFGLLVFGRSLGQMAAGLLNQTLPVAILAQLVWGLQLPASVSSLLTAVGVVAVAVAISYAIAYLLGILGFWVWTTEHFEWLLGAFVQVLSGAIIPFWFLPVWLQAVGGVLPFQMQGYTPVALYLGKLSAGDAARLIAVGCAWAVGLWVLVAVCWQRAMARLVIQGG